MCPDEIVSEGFSRFYRFSPMIFIAFTLVLPIEQKDIIAELCHIINVVEVLRRKTIDDVSTPWGRYVVKASETVVTEFRKVVLENAYDDSEMCLSVLNRLLEIFRKLQFHSTDGITTEFQIAAMPSGCIVFDYMQPEDDMIRACRRDFAPSEKAVQLAIASSHNDPVRMKREFIALDSRAYEGWYSSSVAPWRLIYGQGQCFYALSTDRDGAIDHNWMPENPVWVPAFAVRRLFTYNPYMRCVRVATGRYHVVHHADEWSSDMIPFWRLSPVACVGGTIVPVSLSRLDYRFDSEAFSTVLRSIWSRSHEGVVFSSRVHEAVPPYTSYQYLTGQHCCGYFVLPIHLLICNGRVSFRARFGPDLLAAFHKVGQNKWFSLPCRGGEVVLGFASQFSRLLLLVFLVSNSTRSVKHYPVTAIVSGSA